MTTVKDKNGLRDATPEEELKIAESIPKKDAV